jgi:hypothetical protein
MKNKTGRPGEVAAWEAVRSFQTRAPAMNLVGPDRRAGRSDGGAPSGRALPREGPCEARPVGGFVFPVRAPLKIRRALSPKAGVTKARCHDV